MRMDVDLVSSLHRLREIARTKARKIAKSRAPNFNHPGRKNCSSRPIKFACGLLGFFLTSIALSGPALDFTHGGLFGRTRNTRSITACPAVVAASFPSVFQPRLQTL